MKLNAYMPFYGNDFYAACEGQSDAVTNGYLRCLWYYWHHTHCQGLITDDDFLRRLCRCDLKDWAVTKGTIFGDNGFFKLREGLWHQERASKEFTTAWGKYSGKVDRINEARKQKKPPVISPVINPSNQALITSLHISDSDYDSIPTQNNGSASTSMVKLVLESYGLDPLAPSALRVVQVLRANCAELEAAGITVDRVSKVLAWRKNPKSERTPNSPKSLTDPEKFPQWESMMQQQQRTKNPY